MCERPLLGEAANRRQGTHRSPLGQLAPWRTHSGLRSSERVRGAGRPGRRGRRRSRHGLFGRGRRHVHGHRRNERRHAPMGGALRAAQPSAREAARLREPPALLAVPFLGFPRDHPREQRWLLGRSRLEPVHWPRLPGRIEAPERPWPLSRSCRAAQAVADQTMAF